MKARLEAIEKVIAQGPYEASWESLSAYRPPEWYRDAKFGIFIHWGVYSVPAYDCEWYPRNMYMPGSKAYEHHIATYGPHKEFGYKDWPRSSTRTPGRTCLRGRGRSTWCRWRSITTASRCTRATSPTGTPLRWARSGTCWASWARPAGRRG